MTEPTRKYYQRDIIRICEGRGWTPVEIEQFLNLYNHMTYGYTIEMVDQIEYIVNGGVMKRLHPDMIADVYHGFQD